MAIMEDIVADGSAGRALVSAADAVERAERAVERGHPNRARRLARKAIQIAAQTKKEISPHARGGMDAIFEADRVIFDGNEVLGDADEIENAEQEEALDGDGDDDSLASDEEE